MLMTTFSIAINYELQERSGTNRCLATYKTQVCSQVGVFRENFMATKMSHLNFCRKITCLLKSMRVSCPQTRGIHN